MSKVVINLRSSLTVREQFEASGRRLTAVEKKIAAFDALLQEVERQAAGKPPGSSIVLTVEFTV